MRALVCAAFSIGAIVACSDAFTLADAGDGAGSGGASGEEGSGRAIEGGGDTEGGAGRGMVEDVLAGTAGVRSDGGTPGGGMDPGREPVPDACSSTAQCADGNNCVDELCVPALVTCAAQKNKYPASKDGVYWLRKGDAARRAYCDMQEAVELCSDVEAEHQGRTRDDAELPYLMTSVLLAEEGLCKMWNIRAAADGYPLWMLEPVAGVPAGQTCSRLGFVADGTLGNCPYGSMRGTCGFNVEPLHRYGNQCSACELNDGTYDRFVLQGPVIIGAVLSHASGSKFTTCKTGN